jgi:hypothetical protein
VHHPFAAKARHREQQISYNFSILSAKTMNAGRIPASMTYRLFLQIFRVANGDKISAAMIETVREFGRYGEMGEIGD